MTDLERLVRQLVANLGASDPARIRRPLPLADIRNVILPYRANRRALQLETSEDYEVALMRLCAGEGGFARTDPYEAQVEFAAELESSNPDLTLVQRQEKALIYLDANAIARVTEHNPELAFAPPEPVPDRRRTPRKGSPAREKPANENKVDNGGTRCGRCQGELPTGRVVNFCPQCGQDLRRRHCPQCNTELDPEWMHCVSCGHSFKKRK
jgi:hypothetical protein